MKRLLLVFGLVLQVLVPAGTAPQPVGSSSTGALLTELSQLAALLAPTAVRAADATTVYLPTLTNAYRPELPAILAPETVVVDGALAQTVAGYELSTGVITLTQTVDQPITLTVGAILASGPLPVAPEGFLRRIRSMSTDANQVVLQTDPAALDEALEQGDLRFSHTLTAADIVTPALPSGLSLAPSLSALSQNSLVLRFAEVVVADGDLNPFTTDDQLRVSGNVELTDLIITLNSRVEQGSMTEAEFTLGGPLTTHLHLTHKVTLKKIDGESSLPPLILAGFLVYVGPLPVLVTPQIRLVIGGEGEIDATVELGSVESKSTFKVGAQYASSTWTPISEFSTSTQALGFNVGLGANFKFYVGPRLELGIYGVATAGPAAHVYGIVALEVSTFEVPWYKLYGGVESGVEFRLDVLGHNLLKYSLGALSFRRIIAEAKHNDLFSITISPASPASLKLMAPVTVDLFYSTDEAAGVRIWALPYVNGAPCCAYSGSAVLGYGYGHTQRSVTLLAGTGLIDQIRLQMWSADHQRLLVETVFNVHYLFGP